MFKRKFRLVMLLICVGLFVLLVEETGPGTIASRVYEVGAGFLVLILIAGIRHVLRTMVWYNAIERRERRVRFRDLFGIRLAGEAITDLTILGPLLGETVKGVTLAKHVAAEHSASSVVIENLAYSFAVGLFIFSGIAVFVSVYPVPSAVRAGGLILLAILCVAGFAIGLIVKKRYRVASRVFDRLKKMDLRWLDRLRDKREKVIQFEENVYGFWRAHKATSILILSLELLSIFSGVIEAWIILSLTVHRASLFAAFMVETVNRAVNLFFSFVPMRVGVDEGGAALVLKTVGYGAAEGVSLAIIRKIRTLFWVAVGLVMVNHYSLSLKGKSENRDTVATASK